MDKVSVIIPIYNGEKYIKHIVKCVLNQTFRNIELILVENGSKDRSWEILREISRIDSRIIILQSLKFGTSFARKKGIEYATGKYIVFMDQDDRYKTRTAIEEMYNAIETTKSQICQFSFYINYGFGIIRKKAFVKKIETLEVNTLRNEKISGILGEKGSILNSTVWSKIYLTDILKDAIKYINISLCYAEDVFLNVCCVKSKKIKKITVFPSAFYVWNNHVGFSSSNGAGKALLIDYERVKPLIFDVLNDINSSRKVLFYYHIESIYCHKTYLLRETKSMKKNEAIAFIESELNYNFVSEAKKFVNEKINKDEKWEDLEFLVSDFSAEDFYTRYIQK